MKKRLFKNLGKKPLVGIGPMSINCINSVIELSKKNKLPIMLIPSRRQIDYNAGYVGNLNTKKLSKLINKNKNIILCRDHGGPWQSELENSKKMFLSDAMKSSKKSFEYDIKSNFKILHLDPSIDIHNKLNIDQIIERIKELYEHCWYFAKKNKKDILFEIGTEEQNGLLNSFESFRYAFNEISKFCNFNKIIKPTFFVVQFGTKVMEDKNIGNFNKIENLRDLKRKNKEFLKINDFLIRNKIFTKIHNVDYLSDKHLHFLKKSKVGAINVAPEFGVVETRAFIKTLRDNNLNEILKEFLRLSYNSKKWQKWVINKNKISKFKCSELAGHYIFSSNDFKNLKKEANKYLLKKNIQLNEIMYSAVKNTVSRYLKIFN
mgnify:CR=1 FL=1|tara:strand:- start:1458 stop:2585 length:1128 start_codon:yes stop_codon:yes gene_type:complete